MRLAQGTIVSGKIRTYRDLEIWKLGIEIVKLVYRLTSRFPRQELYGLVSQMRRSAVSVPSNIAEGFRRQYAKEYRQFLSVSLGSCAELETQATIAEELGYVSVSEESQLLEELDHECRMISNLSKTV